MDNNCKNKNKVEKIEIKYVFYIYYLLYNFYQHFMKNEGEIWGGYMDKICSRKGGNVREKESKK